MRAYDIIEKKRDGFPLSSLEINFLINGFVGGTIPDYQVAAWAMAVFFRGMTKEEIQALTQEMINSGDKIDLSEIRGIKVDKHSTGGVGDTTTLILGPLVAAAGIPVAKMSGRGLGHTGGTIDKLEAIPGFNVQIAKEQFIKQVNSIHLAVVGQTGNLVPADKKLYALRDVTATINSIPLIASSIMSKKIAAGADAIVLDVKTGSGAFLKNVEEAKQLAQVMVEIGKGFNKKTMAIITNMDQPLGGAVGNSLEVIEAIETLKGQGPEDLTELCLTLASYMLVFAQKANNFNAGYIQAKDLLASGKALYKFGEFIAAQGGNSKVIENYNLLPQAAEKMEIKSEAEGFVSNIDTTAIGKAAVIIGAGRAKKEDNIDLGVGLIIKKRIADQVKLNEVLAEVYYNPTNNITDAAQIIKNAYSIINEKITRPKLIIETIL